MMVVIALLVFGCGSKEEAEQNSEEQSNEKEEQVKDDNLKKKEEVLPEEDEIQKTQIMKIYYVDADTAQIVCDEIESSNVTPKIIWSEMQEKGILTKECTLKNSDVNTEEKKIDIDVDIEFGNYIRGMGTAGEEEILTCVVRSYLDTYNCEQIKITEEGEALDTGHTVISDYMTRK